MSKVSVSIISSIIGGVVFGMMMRMMGMMKMIAAYSGYFSIKLPLPGKTLSNQ